MKNFFGDVNLQDLEGAKKSFKTRFLLLKNTYRLSYSRLALIFGGKDKTTIHYWVNSKEGFPNEAMLSIIANTFAVSVDWLLGRTDMPYSESMLKNLEENTVVPFIKNFRSGLMVLQLAPEEYLSYPLRKKYYKPGVRANIIFAIISSLYATTFTLYSKERLVESDTEIKTVGEEQKLMLTLDRNLGTVKELPGLLTHEKEEPAYDLEAAIKNPPQNSDK
jgi:hypothetical protein